MKRHVCLEIAKNETFGNNGCVFFWQDPKSLESVFSSLAIQILSLLLCFGSSLSEDEMM